jgi:hypothetical protein
MTRVQVTLRVPGTMPLSALITLIQSVEAAGFDGVGILDSQLPCRDTFVTLGLAAVNTSRLMLFPAVTNPFTRHVSVLAGAALRALLAGKAARPRSCPTRSSRSSATRSASWERPSIAPGGSSR